MSPNRTFPCPACGAPVEPAANAARMACPYCNTSLEIPKKLRFERPVEKTAGTAPDPFARARDAVTPEMQSEKARALEQTAGLLRKIGPLASGAYQTYTWWSLLQRFLPGCLIAMAVVCLLACAIGVLAGIWLPENL